MAEESRMKVRLSDFEAGDKVVLHGAASDSLGKLIVGPKFDYGFYPLYDSLQSMQSKAPWKSLASGDHPARSA